jgi:hypothetical protein
MPASGNEWQCLLLARSQPKDQKNEHGRNKRESAKDSFNRSGSHPAYRHNGTGPLLGVVTTPSNSIRR